jgi:hypothetical protein
MTLSEAEVERTLSAAETIEESLIVIIVAIYRSDRATARGRSGTDLQ